MQFLIEYRFGPDYTVRSEPLREALLAYRMGLGALRLAAQIHSPEGKMIGSVLIVNADNRADADAIAQGDPLAVAGLYSEISLRSCEVRFCDLAAGPP